ncbi:MAG: MFS transporter [Clostridia bacterium]
MKKLSFLKNLSPEVLTIINLFAIQGIFYFAWAFTNYYNVYLQQNGFSASMLGNLNAINSTVAIFAMMFFGMLSDKINSVKKVVILTSVVLALLYFLIPFLPTQTADSVLIFFIFYPIVNIFRASAPILLDNLTVRTCAMKRLNYGFIRSSGSFFFAIGALISVVGITSFGIKSSFFGFSIFLIPSLFLIFRAFDPKVVHEHHHEKKKTSFAPLLKNYYYITFLVVMAIVQFAVNAELNFFSFFMESVGVSSDMFSSILATRAIMEIPCLLFMVKLRKRMKLKYLIMISCCLMGLQCLLLGLFATNLTEIILCATVYGMGNGIFIGTVAMYLYKLAPDNLKASSQTIYAAVTSIAGIGGNLVGGFLFDSVGGRTFFIIVAFIFISGSVVFAVTSKLRKNLVNPADELEK